MTNYEIIELVKQTDLLGIIDSQYYENELWIPDVVEFAKLLAEKEREALEVELLKMKQGVVANSDYIQGRWDLIVEFQDIIKARGQK